MLGARPRASHLRHALHRHVEADIRHKSASTEHKNQGLIKDSMLQDPHPQRPRQVMIAHLEVWLAIEQLLVDDRGEVEVQDDAIVDGQAQHTAHQPVLCLQLYGQVTEPEGACVLHVLEHAKLLQEEDVTVRLPLLG